MPDNASQSDRIAELEARVRLLESENDLLTERSEDMLLLGLIGESLSAADSPRAVLERGLERISMLKSIPVCACYSLEPGGARTLALHSSQVSRPVDPAATPFLWPGALLSAPETVVLSGAELSEVSALISGVRFRPTAVLAMPVSRTDAPPLLFVFADDSGDEHISSQNLLLHRVVDMMVASIDSLELIATMQRLNDELADANAALQQATQAKTDFLSLISHEIRTPMNAILGFAQLLERDPTLTPEQRERLAIIDRNGEYLLDLINDVLEMAKIEVGRSTVTPSAFDLAGMLTDLEAIFFERARTDDIEMKLIVPDDVPRFVETDKAKLRQILVNLLSNAVKFTETGSVTLEVAAESLFEGARGLSFAVSDTGVGVAASEMDLLFEPFSQTQSGRSHGTGTGLGLAISRQYVELLGGRLDAESALGVGSRFSFSIPVTVAEAAEGGAGGPVNRGVRHSAVSGKRILVVDDYAEMRTLLTEMLTNLGYAVEVASDGAEALGQFRSAPPDLMLLDMSMPVMGGLEVMQAIRSGNVAPDTPIVALTANAFSETRGMMLEAGANGYLSKPCSEAELSESIAELLEPTREAMPAPAVGAESIPSHLIPRIRRAAVMGDFDKVTELADEIGEYDAALATRLRQFAAAYDADSIVEAFKG